MIQVNLIKVISFQKLSCISGASSYLICGTSFAVPSLGVKVDAYPGRLNQMSVFINREGVFYGQCSEICGILHSSMPIVIESVSLEKFLAWLDAQ